MEVWMMVVRWWKWRTAGEAVKRWRWRVRHVDFWRIAKVVDGLKSQH